MQKSFTHDTQVFSASNQIVVDDAFIIEMHLKAKKLRAKAFAQSVNFVASSVNSLFASIGKWFNSKVQNTRVMRQLYSMDDRTLADIGLTRGDIEGVLNGTWTRELLQPLVKNLQLIENTNAGKTLAAQDDTRIAA
jgi:uncharacterized protein YjiS (DUF1127 family)